MEEGNWSERRRVPRCAPRPDVRCRVDVRMRVRMVDISATGALLVTETVPAVGTTALLKSALGAGTFACEVQIRRTGITSGASAVGVSFSAIDDRDRRNLDQFLKKASA